MDFKKIKARRSRERTLRWLKIILGITLLLGALISFSTSLGSRFIDKFFHYRDDSYRPMDIERRTYELDKGMEEQYQELDDR